MFHFQRQYFQNVSGHVASTVVRHCCNCIWKTVGTKKDWQNRFYKMQ